MPTKPVDSSVDSNLLAPLTWAALLGLVTACAACSTGGTCNTDELPTAAQSRRGIVNLIGSALLSFTMTIGCGGAQEEPYFTHSQPALRNMTESARIIEVPEATTRAMQSCIEAANRSWKEPTYAFQYRLGANEQGEVLGVKLLDATIRDSSLEACFERALETMDVPEEALRLRSSKPFSGGESTSMSRGSVGVVQAAAAPIALAPILIPALGVTIIVAISLDIIRKATSEPDCKEVKQDCIHACENKLPTGDYGFRFWNCVNGCMRTAGC